MNRTALLAGFAVAIVGVALFFLYMQRFENEATGGEPVEVLMARSDIRIGEPLTTQKLGTRRIPQAYLEDRHVLASDKERVLGIRLGNAVRANQSVLWTDLATTTSERRDLSTLLRAGMRALTVRTGQTSAFGGLLRAGDRVDVLLTATRPNSETDRVTIPLLQNILVLAVGADTGGPDLSDDQQEAAAERRGREVSLAVTLDQATMLTHAKDRGQIQLVLRNPVDDTIIEGVPETTDTDLIAAEERARRNKARPAAVQGIERIDGRNR
ncbi:MAG: Flp pilus assembly protein CpaB [Myxococcales bacterium]|nr:Flp pilus assembly protein CpaB [Myxococcales bacterium]